MSDFRIGKLRNPMNDFLNPQWTARIKKTGNDTALIALERDRQSLNGQRLSTIAPFYL